MSGSGRLVLGLDFLSPNIPTATNAAAASSTIHVDTALDLAHDLNFDYSFVPLGCQGLADGSNKVSGFFPCNANDKSAAGAEGCGCHLSSIQTLNTLKDSASWTGKVAGKVSVDSWSLEAIPKVKAELDLAAYFELPHVLLPPLVFPQAESKSELFRRKFLEARSGDSWVSVREAEFQQLVVKTTQLYHHHQRALPTAASTASNPDEHLMCSIAVLMLRHIQQAPPVVQYWLPLEMKYSPSSSSERNNTTVDYWGAADASTVNDNQWFAFHTLRSLCQCVASKLHFETRRDCNNTQYSSSRGGNNSGFQWGQPAGSSAAHLSAVSDSLFHRVYNALLPVPKFSAPPLLEPSGASWRFPHLNALLGESVPSILLAPAVIVAETSSSDGSSSVDPPEWAPVAGVKSFVAQLLARRANLCLVLSDPRSSTMEHALEAGQHLVALWEDEVGQFSSSAGEKDAEDEDEETESEPPRASEIVRIPDAVAAPSEEAETSLPLPPSVQDLPKFSTCFSKSAAVANHTQCTVFEDGLQHPMQPLGDHLPSNIYETFEKDVPKYKQYQQAVYYRLLELLRFPEETHRSQQQPTADSEAPRKERDTEIHITVLGAGRGPLVDASLRAAEQARRSVGEAASGVRFVNNVIEKNPSACSYLRLRSAVDPLWTCYTNTNSMTEIRVLEGDGRTVVGNITQQRRDDGSCYLCDILVSELLGSIGDNELSPECIEGFVGSIKAQGGTDGYSHNRHLVSIPQDYTSYLAPVTAQKAQQNISTLSRSRPLVPLWREGEKSEQQLSEAAAYLEASPSSFQTAYVSRLWRYVSLVAPCSTRSTDDVATAMTVDGLYVTPPQTEADRHAAVNPMGVRPWLTFKHPAANIEEDTPFSKSSTLDFTSTASAGVITGMVGYFDSVLYRPRPELWTEGKVPGPVTMSSVPGSGCTFNMYSWFPLYLPLPQSEHLNVGMGDSIMVNVERRHTEGTVSRNSTDEGSAESPAVWLEWSVSVHQAKGNQTKHTATINYEGSFSRMSLVSE